MASSPLIVVPIASSVPSCSEPSKCGPARAEHAERLVRRPTLTAPARAAVSKARVGTKKRALRSNKETDEGEKDALCRQDLLTYPIQGLLSVHSRYGLHTRAVTVYRDTLIEGFSHFVTSMTAPIASGWSVCRGRDRGAARATLGEGLSVSAFPLYVPV